jgi:hypothetical protein
MRIFNLQGLGAPDKPKKKKIKYAEIDFTSYHSFLRVRRDQLRQNCKKTHPIVECQIRLFDLLHIFLDAPGVIRAFLVPKFMT